MNEYINFIKTTKTPEELEKEFIREFINFRKENNLTQELLSIYSHVNRVKIARIESGMHSTTIKNLLEIIGPIGYTIKIEKINDEKKNKRI